MKSCLTPLGLVVCLAGFPLVAQAQSNANRSEAPLTVGTHLYAPPMSVPVTALSPVSATAAVTDGISLSSHLNLQSAQIERLNRLYDAYASERLKQEKKLDEWQGQLKEAQSPASFNERKASDLMRDINKAQQKVAENFLSARSKSLAVLNDTQRIQLQALSSDSKTKVQTDKFYQLLLLPAADFWRLPLDSDSEQRLLSQRDYKERQKRSAGVGNYGVYAGYGYGHPEYGVYGGYGRDGVGVSVGINRGGPAFGINIGNVFSIGR